MPLPDKGPTITPDRRAELAEMLGVANADEFAATLATVEARFGRNIWTTRERLRRQYKGLYGREFVAEAMRNYGYTTWRATTVYKVERAERHIRLDEAIALCVLLNVRPADMLVLELKFPDESSTEKGV